jgi:predicted Zn-dependent protease with MMP-like domain
MERERFENLVEEALDGIPPPFAKYIKNVVVQVEDYPPEQTLRGRGPRPQALEPTRPRRLLLGVFVGVPRTRKSVFDMQIEPDHVVLYQKNIEAVCRTDDEIREQARLTVIHELGHYFGLDEEALKDV